MFRRLARVELALFALIIASIVGITAGAVDHVHSREMDKRFKPFLNSAKLQTIKEQANSAKYYKGNRNIITGAKTYSFTSSDYNYFIDIPGPFNYGANGGNISVTSIPEVDGSGRYVSDYQFYLMIFPKDWTYHLGLTDLRTIGKVGYGGIVDKDAQPLGKYPESTEESYQNFLKLYEKHHDEIMEMFADVKEVFGEYALR